MDACTWDIKQRKSSLFLPYEKYYSILKAKLKAKWNSMQKEIEEINL